MIGTLIMALRNVCAESAFASSVFAIGQNLSCSASRWRNYQLPNFATLSVKRVASKRGATGSSKQPLNRQEWLRRLAHLCLYPLFALGIVSKKTKAILIYNIYSEVTSCPRTSKPVFPGFFFIRSGSRIVSLMTARGFRLAEEIFDSGKSQDALFLCAAIKATASGPRGQFSGCLEKP